MVRRALLGALGCLTIVALPLGMGCAASGDSSPLPTPGGQGGSTADASESGAQGGSAGQGGAGGQSGSGGSTGAGGTSGAGGSAGADAGPDAEPDAEPDAPADAPAEASCAAGCPAGTWDIDGNQLTGACGCEYVCNKVSQDDPVDAEYKDDNCDGSDGVVEKCVYVASNGVDANTGGGRTAPVKTIAFAIQLAKTKNVDVCLSGEMYTGTVTMMSGVSVYGGFEQNNAEFAFRRSANATTTVTAPGTVFEAATIDADTHIEGMTIHATTPVGTGLSTYGVRLGAGIGKLYVRYNTINSDAGTDGTDGQDAGSPGANGQTGSVGGAGCDGCCSGGTGGLGGVSSCGAVGGIGGNGGCQAASGQTGGAGSLGAPGGSGASASSCFGGGNGGGGGTTVTQAGAPGSPGGSCDPLGLLSSGGLYSPPIAPSGKAGSPGGSGGGGGGGGGGDTAGGVFCYADRGGGGGGGGAGGCGGPFGSGGQGGGGSFGITASGGTLVVEGNTITVQSGGKGGKGGRGNTGGLPGMGGKGASGDYDDGGPGGNGGDGAPGGAGGPGSGGVGGPSTCVGVAATVNLTFQIGLGWTQNSCTNGGGGGGGLPATNDGMTSQAGPTGKSSSQILF